ncbi:carbohydrate porin [Caenimonas terrae]|uniref:Carbohydrate porin n=1 Tax=Caenimonas terrae TaxID=696074 RepID=A0ABW0NC43_9BURK
MNQRRPDIHDLTGLRTFARLAGAALVASAAGFGSYAGAAEPARPDADGGAASEGDLPRGLLGDMGGLRPALARHGTVLGLTEASEVTGVLRGGLRQGQAYRGLTTLNLTMDTEQAGAWHGGTLFASALQIHGREFTPEYVGSFHTASNLEARRATRLWELWYRHQVSGSLDIKVGQQSIDQEFMINGGAAPFAAAYFGWPALPSVDLPASGGVYPLASLGVRVRAQLSETSTLLAGVFAGDAANSSSQDAQVANPRGTTFSLHGGTLAIAEYQYAVNQAAPGETQGATGLPATYKLGVWHHSKSFADQRRDAQGLSQADPASNAGPAQHRGNFSLYATADRMLWRAQAGPGAVNVFLRAMAAPSDRNLVSFSADAGLTVTAPFAARPHDVLGVGVAFLKLSQDALALDRDLNAFNNTRIPVRSHETLLEATYVYQLAPSWLLQGVLQYTIRPAAGAVDPADAARKQRIPNATAVGLRTTMTF